MPKAERLRLKREQLAESLVSGAVRPRILDDPLYIAARATWDEYAPELRRTGRLQKAHEMQFAIFCVYHADWWANDRIIKDEGATQRVKTVAGGYMVRMRPEVHLRELAMKRTLELGDRFGLTPTEEYKLFKDQQIVRRENPGLFGDVAPALPASTPRDEQQDLQLGGVGGMKGLRSGPPLQ